jgi:hypothetical protein
MIRVLTFVALVVTITAGSLLAYRNQPYSVRIERAGEVKKDRETVRAAETPPVQLPTPFGPVPHVTVIASPVAPAPGVVPSTAPTPAPVLHKRKPKAHKAAKKLQSKWSSPAEKNAFDQMKDMFR